MYYAGVSATVLVYVPSTFSILSVKMKLSRYYVKLDLVSYYIQTSFPFQSAKQFFTLKNLR